MKISCQSCQAKYTIADEKVLGKIVKIRCKKCSATIVINGNEQAASGGGGGGGDGDVFDYTAQSGTEQWTVNVADGDQRTLTSQEIVAEYRAGVVNDETYCWKDGMPDWLPLREIEQLYASCQNRSSLAPELAYAEASPLSIGNPEPPAYDHQESTATEQIPVSSHGNGRNGNGASAGLFGSSPPPAVAPVAARRVGGRAGGGDLFGGASAAGGEDDVMTSAPVGTPEMQGDQKLTGQRNENSVLFSLTALTANEEKKPSAAPVGDGSGLIDIRALSANMNDKKEDKSSHVDDIMNLGGGGAFGAALAAPILAPPPVDTIDLATGESTGGKNKNLVMYGVIGAVFLGMLGTIIFLVTRHPDAPVAMPTAVPTQTAAPVPTDTAPVAATGTGTSAPMAMNDPKTGAGAAAASPTDKPAAATAPKGGGGGGGGGGATAPKPGGGGGGGGGGGMVAAKDPTPDPPKLPKGGGGGGGGGLADAIKQSAGGGDSTPPPAAAASDRPFDRGAAAAALGGVNVGSCAKGDGPTGSGHISVTFGGDGSVISAVVDQPPFAGTPRGGCVAGKFRAVHIPAFSGGNVKVGKSFTIN